MRAAVDVGEELAAENDGSLVDGWEREVGRGGTGRRLELMYQRVIDAAVARDLHALRTRVADLAGESGEREELTEMQFLFGEYE